MHTRSCQQEDTTNPQTQHIYLAKQAWRRWAKTTRARLPLESYNAQLCDVLAKAALVQQATHILAYLPTKQELDITPLLLRWQQQGTKIYITRTWPASDSLTVHLLEPDALELHRYGYWQPQAQADTIDPRCLQLALVPGLCFDLQGQRLGYGAGYFDRLLARCNNVTTIGVTCQALLIQHVPHEATDIAMDYLATEQAVLERLH
jgi:5-formyltetrahydrofolate cyclo-ligase